MSRSLYNTPIMSNNQKHLLLMSYVFDFFTKNLKTCFLYSSLLILFLFFIICFVYAETSFCMFNLFFVIYIVNVF